MASLLPGKYGTLTEAEGVCFQARRPFGHPARLDTVGVGDISLCRYLYRFAVTTMDGDTDLARVFKALGHPARLLLLRAMASEPLCVQHLQHRLGTSQPNVSQHLAILRDRGLVVAERQGSKTCYRLADGGVEEIIALGEALIRERGKQKREGSL